MEPQNDMEIRLWEYIDGFSTTEERSSIERLIRENSEWKSKYNELLELHQSIDMMELEQPSLRFTKNVMEEIGRLHIAPASREYINSKIIWGIGAFFITVIVAFLVYGVSQIDWSSGSKIENDVLDKITGADYSKMFNNTFVNGFLMLNVVLGLLLFDRYLSDKRKKMGMDAFQ
jgi:hypothetical protein